MIIIIWNTIKWFVLALHILFYFGRKFYLFTYIINDELIDDVLYKDVLFEYLWFKDVLYKDVCFTKGRNYVPKSRSKLFEDEHLKRQKIEEFGPMKEVSCA